MARIIPWKLPDVKGGSIGGYTPATPVDPVPEPDPEPLVYYDFDNADIINGGSGNFEFWMDSIVINAHTSVDVVPTSVRYGTLAGIVTNTTIGVASVSVLVKFTYKYNNETFSSSTLKLSVDPVTLNITGYSAGNVQLANDSGHSSTWGNIPVYVSAYPSRTSDLSLTFIVYNGNGEIIQQSDEIVLIGGE